MASYILPFRYPFLLICSLLPVSSFPESLPRTVAVSYDYGFDPLAHVKRQDPGTYAITGPLGGYGPNDSIPVRQEIRQIELDSDLWDLYMLGLDMMQFASQDNIFSYYQIAGIHGRPYLPWDGVQATPGNEQNGYCTHVSTLFLTWHRPFLALYEQILYNYVQMIASWYPAGPTKDRYVAAAARFRMPYWDWAAVPSFDESVLPYSVGGSPIVKVRGPNGNQTIANPLYSFAFKPLDNATLPDFPFSHWTETMRYPTTQDATATSQNDLVAAQLDNNAPSFRNRLYNLLTQYDNYTIFSNEAWTGASKSIARHDSMESVHDQIHGLTGSGGHMGYVDYSAYDPIFFLHHTMIDRCFAMWQVLHPNSFVTPELSTYGTFTTSPGQVENDVTPLTPFRNDTTGNFWTSRAARYTETFGYAYAETAKISGQSTSQMKDTVKTAINTLYGTTAPGSVVSKVRRRSSLKAQCGRYDHVLSDVGDFTPGCKYREWIANLRVRKHACAAPFFIHLFLGPFSPDPFSWSFEPNLIGTHCIFMRAGQHPVNSSTEVTGTIPMTHALLDRIDQGVLASLGEADVEKYLLGNMRYRITMLDDTEVPNSAIPDLKITVVSAPALKAESMTDFPVWGPFVESVDIDGCA